MNYKEYRQCQTVARMFNDKVAEYKALQERMQALERENKLLKERLGYRKITDANYAAADEDCIAIFRARDAMRTA